jgi:septal ring factor EnvC (AmiA/AmiB activator)
MDYTSLVIGLFAAIMSGMGTAVIAGLKENKKEKIRQTEREQDHLKLEIKDLKISLYQLEKELTEWKDKYYSAIQDLIGVKSELENALVQLNIIELRDVDSEY